MTQTETIKMLREALEVMDATSHGQAIEGSLRYRLAAQIEALSATQEPQEAPEPVEIEGWLVEHDGTEPFYGSARYLTLKNANSPEFWVNGHISKGCTITGLAAIDGLRKLSGFGDALDPNASHNMRSTHPSKEAADTAMSGEFWLQHDDELRYVKRVLESGRDMTEADRIAALEMIHSLRTIIRAAPQAASAVPSEREMYAICMQVAEAAYKQGCGQDRALPSDMLREIVKDELSRAALASQGETIAPVSDELPPLPPFDYYMTLENGDDYGCWSSSTMRNYGQLCRSLARTATPEWISAEDRDALIVKVGAAAGVLTSPAIMKFARALLVASASTQEKQ